MFSKASSFTYLRSAFIALLLSQSCTARDLRVFPSSSNACSGAYLACGNLAAGTCCSSSANPWASHQLTGSSSGVIWTIGYSNPSCVGSQAVAIATGCVATTFAMHSGRWEATGSGVALIPPEAQRTEKCAEIESFGYTDESGKSFQGSIPEGRREEVLEAVTKNNVSLLKSLL